MRCLRLFGLALAATSPIAASADTQTYSYDTKGRLIARESRSAGNIGGAACYRFDGVDNRTRTVTRTAHRVTYLDSNVALAPCQGIKSADMRFVFLFYVDGRVALLNQAGRVLWQIGPYGAATQLSMQSDGNLVLYNGSTPLWASGTSGNPGARLSVQNDGNVVIYSTTGSPLWATNTSGQ